MIKRLTIGTPCHEDWEKMTPNSEGRFCQSCEKTVVDMTRMSQPEMLAIFKAKNHNMCGQMRVPVNRNSRPAFRGAEIKLTGKLKKFAIALLVVLGLATFSGTTLYAQNHVLRGDVAYYEGADMAAYVEAGGVPVKGAQVQLKSGREVIAERFTNEEGFVTFADIEYGDYDLVVRWQNEKMASRTVSLMTLSNAQQNFYFEKTDDRWKEVISGLKPIELIEPRTEILERSIGEPVEMPYVEPLTVDPGIIESETSAVRENEAENVVQEGNITSDMGVSVFPNPMDGIFFTQISGTKKGATVSVMVFDAQGRVLRKETHEGGTDLYLQVDLSDEAAGIYFVKVIHGAQMVEKRVVKM